MPVVKVWCLPDYLSEKDLRAIHKDIVAGAVSVPEVGVRDETSMTVLFPKDMMSYGLGTEVIIEVTSGAFGERNLGVEVRNRFATAMVHAVLKHIKGVMIECFILPYRREDGFYQSPGNLSVTEGPHHGQIPHSD
jgi:hypothetical protein